MSRKNRRQFIREGLLSLTGAGLAARSLGAHSMTAPSANQAMGGSETGPEKLIYRTLGRTGEKVPVIGMGTGDTDNPRLVEAAMDKGLRIYATSHYYGNGKNEKMMGELIRKRKRESCLIATSVNPGEVDHQNGLFKNETDAKKFKRDMEGSLVGMGLEQVDIFFLPFAARRESVFFEPLLRAMEDIKKEGKTRFIGIATHSWEAQAIRAAADAEIYDVVMTAYNFKHGYIEEIDEALAYAAGKGVGTIAMKTMAGGGYWDKERTQPLNTTAALKWIIQNENIHTTVPGITTFEQLEANAAIMADPEMTEKEKQDLIPPEVEESTGLYCLQCRKCMEQCPAGIDIPSHMRSYMYAYGYRNLAHAKQSLEYAGPDRLPCTDCTSCKVKCKSGFDVRNRLMDISRLHNVPNEFLV